MEGPDGPERLRQPGGFDYKSCDMGLAVKPKKGDGLLFFSTYPNRTVDPRSLHGGCAVHAGTKWAAVKWMRDELF